MKAIIATGVVGLMAVARAFDFPSVQIVEETRKPGMPYLHPPAKVLLGKPSNLITPLKGCSDSATSSNCT